MLDSGSITAAMQRSNFRDKKTELFLQRRRELLAQKASQKEQKEVEKPKEEQPVVPRSTTWADKAKKKPVPIVGEEKVVKKNVPQDEKPVKMVVKKEEPNVKEEPVVKEDLVAKKELDDRKKVEAKIGKVEWNDQDKGQLVIPEEDEFVKVEKKKKELKKKTYTKQFFGVCSLGEKRYVSKPPEVKVVPKLEEYPSLSPSPQQSSPSPTTVWNASKEAIVDMAKNRVIKPIKEEAPVVEEEKKKGVVFKRLTPSPKGDIRPLVVPSPSRFFRQQEPLDEEDERPRDWADDDGNFPEYNSDMESECLPVEDEEEDEEEDDGYY